MFRNTINQHRERGLRISFLFIRSKIIYFGFLTPYCRNTLVDNPLQRLEFLEQCDISHQVF
ncbi:unnamed protein product, partial [Vitis vinifera]|uniref:Uncharacterized protein n=1 Tax=Vitis vinifera TaxID=29760 RepID=D7U3X2_VITVI